MNTSIDIVLEKYHTLISLLIDKSLSISTMESCTGGLIGSLLSDKEGASAVVSGGYFTYSNNTKVSAGVPTEIIDTYGVYSLQTAVAMADAVRDRLHTDIGIGVTGSIGTIDPANADSVPGEVYIAINIQDNISSQLIKLPITLSDKSLSINHTPTRWESKLYIADKVCELLTDSITMQDF